MVKYLSWLVLLILSAVIPVQAQTATGVIAGTVKDDTGAIVVGAKLKLIDQTTSQSREQSSNADGIFEFRALARGE